MKSLGLLSKTFLFTSILLGSLWMGGYLLRLVVFYQLFKAEEFVLSSFLNIENLPGIFMILRSAVAMTLILFPLFILSYISFLFSSKINLKQNGWLFIITILIFITLPFEIYLMTIDYDIVFKINYSSFRTDDVLNLVIKRFKVLSSFPIIELICYFSVIYLMIFQPLKIKKAE
ncbi:MAG: hypothetical protein ACM34M_02260 [Ignavibacteria bacterium]